MPAALGLAQCFRAVWRLLCRQWRASPTVFSPKRVSAQRGSEIAAPITDRRTNHGLVQPT